jgi:hypothetical protein
MKATKDVESWNGILQATKWSASAIQGEQIPSGTWTEEFIIKETGYSEDSCI